jgi:hypothetical protein
MTFGSLIPFGNFFLRYAVAIVISAVQLAWMGSMAPTAQADESDPYEPRPAPRSLDPETRVQVLLKHVIVHSDGDWHGSGEIGMTFIVFRCVEDDCRTIVRSKIDFSADSGDVVSLNRPIPLDGDRMAHDVTETFGLPLDPEARYTVFLDLVESDSWCCQYTPPAGEIFEMTAANGWLIGRHDYQTGPHQTPALTIGYEIRQMPLPDLRPIDITVTELPGTTDDLVCMVVKNVGPMEAGPFQSALRLNGQPMANGVAQAGRLGAQQQGDLCVQTRLPANQGFELSAVVDEPRGIFEINERNNTLDKHFLGRQTSNLVGASAEAVQPETGHSSTSLADLMVESVRVRGKEPGGQTDCDPGTNDVIVVVKNRGNGAVRATAVRLIVDEEDSEAQEQTVASLDAAGTTEIVFDDVRLKSGQRKLSLILDPQKSISESDEENNIRVLTVNCRNED